MAKGVCAGLLCLLMLPAGPAWPGEEQGSEILDTCRSEPLALAGDPVGSVRYGLCLGYLKGIADMRDGDGFCLPGMGSARLTQALKHAYLEYAERHPETLSSAARNSVLPAFREAFPCRH